MFVYLWDSSTATPNVIAAQPKATGRVIGIVLNIQMQFGWLFHYYFTWWPEYQQHIAEFCITFNCLECKKGRCLLPSKTKPVIQSFLLTFPDYFSLLNEKVPMSSSDNSEFCLNSPHHWHDTNKSINMALSKQTSFVQRCLHFLLNTEHNKLFYWMNRMNLLLKIHEIWTKMAKKKDTPYFSPWAWPYRPPV